MTKQELIEALEPYNDDMEIFIVTRELDCNNLTHVEDIIQVIGYTWPHGKEEIWLHPGKTL